MKTVILIIGLQLAIAQKGMAAPATNPTDPNKVLTEMANQIKQTNGQYWPLIANCEFEINVANGELAKVKGTECQLELLVRKELLMVRRSALIADNNNDISKIRYLKGLQIIKILYEKVLSLDHHFSSVRTLNEINKISNPNQYPEYGKLKEVIATRRDKKFAFDLTPVLGSNAVVSVVQTLSTMVNTSMTRQEKEKELANVECILDFTLRMQNDLNTIYFETAFLQASNDKMKEEIEILFRDYTKPINYSATLESCRTNDDWETLTKKINDYLAEVKVATGPNQFRMQVNLEFSIDRLLQFIILYNNFIDQGGKFYEKFKVILNSYENEQQCQSKLPVEYQKLKSDIDVAIQKFNVAYKPVEVNGSKMKEILYGLNEFQ